MNADTVANLNLQEFSLTARMLRGHAQIDFVGTRTNQKPCGRLAHQSPEVFLPQCSYLVVVSNSTHLNFLAGRAPLFGEISNMQRCFSHKSFIRLVLVAWIKHRNLSVKVPEGKCFSCIFSFQLENSSDIFYVSGIGFPCNRPRTSCSMSCNYDQHGLGVLGSELLRATI